MPTAKPSRSRSAHKAAEKNKGGRPSKYTKELGNRICAGLMMGLSLRSICDRESIDRGTVFNWLRGNPEFFDQYAKAREVQADVMADEIVDIADDGENDYMTIVKGDKEYNVVNSEAINRSRLRVDARKWVSSKLLPKKYGDRATLEHSGKDGGPISFRLERIAGS